MPLDQQYARGRLNEEDKGELTLAMCVQGGHVMLYFGKPVEWLGLDKQDVLALCERLERYALTADRMPLREPANASKVEPALSVESGVVRIDFPTAVTHMCLTPDRAHRFISELALQGQRIGVTRGGPSPV